MFNYLFHGEEIMTSRIKKDELIDSMLHNGFTYAQIADELAVGYSTISKRFRHGNFPERESNKKNHRNNPTTKNTIATTRRELKANYKNSMTPEDFDFLCNIIIKLSKRPGGLSTENFKRAMIILAKYQ